MPNADQLEKEVQNLESETMTIEAPDPKEMPEPKKKSHKGPPKKKVHPSLFDEEGNPQKITDIPEDYDSTIHKVLKEDDFEKPEVYWDWKAQGLEEEAAECRATAERYRKFGHGQTAKKANKYLQLQKQIEALRAELGEEGFDLSDLPELE